MRRLAETLLLLTVAANAYHALVAACRWVCSRAVYRQYGRPVDLADLLAEDIR